MKRRDLINVGIFLVAAAGVLLLPRLPWVSDFRAQQFAYVGIYFIALLGLNLLTGFTGQISLGHGAFMLIGGYTTAILMSEQTPRSSLPAISSRVTCGTSGRSRSRVSSRGSPASSSASRRSA